MSHAGKQIGPVHIQTWAELDGQHSFFDTCVLVDLLVTATGQAEQSEWNTKAQLAKKRSKLGLISPTVVMELYQQVAKLFYEQPELTLSKNLKIDGAGLNELQENLTKLRNELIDQPWKDLSRLDRTRIKRLVLPYLAQCLAAFLNEFSLVKRISTQSLNKNYLDALGTTSLYGTDAFIAAEVCSSRVDVFLTSDEGDFGTQRCREWFGESSIRLANHRRLL
jgi:hypothetical protein